MFEMGVSYYKILRNILKFDSTRSIIKF